MMFEEKLDTVVAGLGACAGGREMSDLISRDTVLEVIRTTGVASAQEKLRIIAAVRVVPTVEAEPVVHAHWFTQDDSHGWFGEVVYCSACKCGDSTVRSPRCRYCGAHMDEEVADA